MAPDATETSARGEFAMFIRMRSFSGGGPYICIGYHVLNLYVRINSMKYFSIRELIRSETALRLGLDNTPSHEHLANLKQLVDLLLDPLREAWGAECARRGFGDPALIVTSGYRGFRLNEAVEGSATSAHCCGSAADLVARNGRMADFRDFCRAWLADKPFDQLISEKESADGMPVWIHIGYKNRRGAQRRQCLIFRNGRYLPM